MVENEHRYFAPTFWRTGQWVQKQRNNLSPCNLSSTG